MFDLSQLTVVELEALEIQVSLELLDRACEGINRDLDDICLETEIESQNGKEEFRAYKVCV